MPAENYCDVMRPAENRGSSGQDQGTPTVVVKDWPCRIIPTGGVETERAGSTFFDASYQVEGYADPENPIRAKDYLSLNGRRLMISDVQDPRMNGEEVILACTEQRK